MRDFLLEVGINAWGEEITFVNIDMNTSSFPECLQRRSKTFSRISISSFMFDLTWSSAARFGAILPGRLAY